MLHRHSVLALMAIAVFWFGTAGATAKYSTVRITLDKKTDYQIVRSLGFDVVTLGEGYAEAILAPGDLERLQSTGLKYTITIDDMTAFYRSRLESEPLHGGLSHLERNRACARLDLTTLTPTSSLRSGVSAIVSKDDQSGSSRFRTIPNVDEDEPEVYYYACHHAREVITPEVLIYFMRYLTNNYGTDPQVTYLVDNRELFFSPCLNPDGYYYNEETISRWRWNVAQEPS